MDSPVSSKTGLVRYALVPAWSSVYRVVVLFTVYCSLSPRPLGIAEVGPVTIIGALEAVERVVGVGDGLRRATECRFMRYCE